MVASVVVYLSSLFPASRKKIPTRDALCVVFITLVIELVVTCVDECRNWQEKKNC